MSSQDIHIVVDKNPTQATEQLEMQKAGDALSRSRRHPSIAELSWFDQVLYSAIITASFSLVSSLLQLLHYPQWLIIAIACVVALLGAVSAFKIKNRPVKFALIVLAIAGLIIGIDWGAFHAQ
jgi:hypothetical protein